MNLKNEIDEILRRTFYLTEAIKELAPLVELTGNRKTKAVLIETLYEYQTVSTKARELLAEYIQQERAIGSPTNLEYIRIYRKLGEENV